MIASDIDGTLIKESTPDLYPEMAELIHEMSAKGIWFCTASGRQYASVRNVFIPKGQYQGTGRKNIHSGMAGQSYAVENAVEEVKKAAGSVCPGYMDRGVYKIIKKLLEAY